jgi:S-formylglutathione hydrolase
MNTSKLIQAEYTSELIPEPLQYAVLLPDGYKERSNMFPLLYFLHGGGGDSSLLVQEQLFFEKLWKNETLPPIVVVTPSVGDSQYMNYRDNSQKWEQLLTGPFLAFLRNTYNLQQDARGTLLFGISMGGLGALRMGFKYPEIFGGLAALEPGVMPSLVWKAEVQQRNLFWRSKEQEEAIYGSPIDKDYWYANNPVSIAVDNAAKIRTSKLAIYLDCGDEDTLLTYEGVEFLHRILWDHHISHEYHLVRGADHVGLFLKERSIEGLAFLGRLLTPPPVDPEVIAFRKQMRGI